MIISSAKNLIRKEIIVMKLFKKLLYSLFGLDLTSETERQEWALAILGFSFLDEMDFEECDELENIETAGETKRLK
ncbi:hypothetical protein [Desulfosporosinus sp. OT]|uniref:hypothetical protein n=1 Tax=Desulfosporosinus sp. OT TaxID=913865 RepID=UPI000223ACED|nr:hypothetical protein [Desulfosporosinus sp. OT]EGW36180.1 hypothetical protein DOT_5918 [Desulfosporosinus sp. OT]